MPASERLRALLALAIGLVLAVGAAELLLRIVGFSYPSFYAVDRHLGYRLRPNVEGMYREEGVALVRINSAGMRDRDHLVPKPDGVFRIAVLGDSYAEAMQVPADSTFWAEAERRVTACGAVAPSRVEVVNFGVAGYSTLQEVLQYERDAARYQPDLVLLAFLSGNDVRDDSRTLAQALVRPYPVLSADSLHTDSAFTQTRTFRLKSGLPWRVVQTASDYFRSVQLINLALNRRSQARAVSNDSLAWEAGLDQAVYAVAPGTAWQDAWQATELLITRLSRRVARDGGRFVLVSLSNAQQVHPDTAIQNTLARQLGAPDLFNPERRLAALSVRDSVEYLPLAPELKRRAVEGQTHLHGFSNTTMGLGHWNTTGHREAGRLIGAYLCGEWQPEMPR